MLVEKTSLPNVYIIKPSRLVDDRGFFEESWSNATFIDNDLNISFVQDNHSYSKELGTLRGLHYQSPPYAQDKLVRCTRGKIYDVAVDIRDGSSTYGNWVGVELSRDNGKQLLVPKGFLHGFLTLEKNTEVQYKCSSYYSSSCDGSVLWNSLNINWPLPKGFMPKLSTKDENAQHFEVFKSPFKWDDKL